MSTETEYDIIRRNVRGVVRGAYGLQKLRISIGLRLVAQFKAKLGQAPSTPELELDAKGKALLKKIRAEYELITDGITINLKLKRTFKGEGIISDFAEIALIQQYENQLYVEKQAFSTLEHVLKGIPLWDTYLEGVKGVGPAIAGIIISEIDIRKCKYASSINRYVGIDVAEDGRGRGKYKEHLVEQTYIDSNGEEKTKMGITFNPFAKSKIVYLLGGSFLKSKSPYADAYRDYKHRLQNRADIKVIRDERDALIDEYMGLGTPEKKESKAAYKRRLDRAKSNARSYYPKYTDGHLDAMSNRFMVKLFLQDLYSNWRALEGLTVHPPYHEAKLGLKHGQEVAT